MSETPRHYALKGIIRGQHKTTEVRFSAPASDDPWDVADAVSIPTGFEATMLVEIFGRRQRLLFLQRKSVGAKP